MPKYTVVINTEDLNEPQLRKLTTELSTLSYLEDEHKVEIIHTIKLSEVVPIMMLEQHIKERVR